ncbi:MAG: CHAT domain-containing protein [Rhizobiaceae bacterium]
MATTTLDVTPLPETREEVEAIGKLLGANLQSDIILGQAVSKANVESSPLERFKIINFATHGVLANEVSGFAEPAVLLAAPTEIKSANDGVLTSTEIAQLKLDADLVILSACNTAGSDGTPRAEGLSGLANSFFYSGAKSIVVTQWEIPSKPAVEKKWLK